MDQEIVSAMWRALYNKKAPAHIRIMIGNRNAKGAIIAIPNPNSIADLTLHYGDIIFTAVRTVVAGVLHVEENQCWEWQMLHAVSLIWYLGILRDGLQQMGDNVKQRTRE
jgi:hypothetical protein